MTPVRRSLAPVASPLLILGLVLAFGAALAGQQTAAAPDALQATNTQGSFQIQVTSTPTSRSSVPSRTPTPTNTRPVSPTPTFTLTASPTPTFTASPHATLPGFTILTPTPIVDVFDFPPGDLTGPVPTATPPQLVGNAPVPDLIAYDIEITQGMQSLAQHMPLAADRITYVRIYVETDGADYADVRGLLEGTRNGQVLGVIPADNQPILAKGDGGERINVNDSLYFALPWSWFSEGTLHLEAFVYAGNTNAPFEHEPESFNNFIQTSAIFHEAAGFNLSFIPIHLHQNYDPNQPEVLFTQAEPGFWAVVIGMLRHLPLPDFTLYAPPVDKIYCHAVGGSEAGVFGALNPIGEHGDCEFDLSVPGGAQLVNVMMSLMDMFTDDASENLQYYGMVHPDFEPQMFFYNSEGGVISYTGLASSGQSYGLMETIPDANSPWFMRGGMTLAHELGHRLGLGHVNCSGSEEANGGLDPDFPWTNPDCKIALLNPEGFYGFDVWYSVLPGVNEPTVISNDPSAGAPNVGWPMMGYTKPQYMDAYHWCVLLDSIGVNCTPETTPFQALIGSQGLARSVPDEAHAHDLLDSTGHGFGGLQPQAASFLAVAGSIQKDPVQASLGLVMTLPDPPADFAEPSSASTLETGFEVALLDPDGQLLASEPIVETNINHDSLNIVPFVMAVPLAPGTSQVEIRRQGEILAERVFSPNAPEVELLTPNGGEVYTSPFEVRWQASDADGDDLTYTLQYSPDSGQTWQVLAFGLTDESHQVLSLYNLTGSDQAKIRVLATDGGNTGVDVSDGDFSVPNTPPLPVIQSPGHLADFPLGGRIPLSGSATDREDGVLPAQALTWESNLDGFLGTGDKLEPTTLSAGNHVLTLTAEDSDGAIAQAQVGVVVNGAWLRSPPSDEELALGRQILAAGPDWTPPVSGPLTGSLMLVLLGGALAVGLVLGLLLLLPLLRSWLRR
jgi:hypothetical protein